MNTKQENDVIEAGIPLMTGIEGIIIGLANGTMSIEQIKNAREAIRVQHTCFQMLVTTLLEGSGKVRGFEL